MTHLQQNERRVLNFNKASCVRARHAATREDFATACRELAIARAVCNRSTLSRETDLLVESEVLAVEATIEFCAHNYPASKQVLFKNSLADQMLEDEFGIADLHAHRVHLLSKHVQLASYAEGPEEALRIAAAVMCYLHGEPLDFAVAGDWSQSRVRKLPLGIRRFLVRQLTTEIGAALLYAREEIRRQAIAAFSAIVCPDRFDSLLDPFTGLYLQALQLSIESERVMEHIAAATNMLACGAQGSETLWFMCALDAAERCRHLDQNQALEFRQLSLKDASQHKAFPSSLRHRWHRMAADCSQHLDLASSRSDISTDSQ